MMQRSGAALLLAAAMFTAAAYPAPAASARPVEAPVPFQVAELACAYCKRPITDTYVTSHGKTYHERCFVDHVAPKCVVCGKPITSDFLRDPWGNAFHSEHQGQTPQCAYCSRILSTTSSRGGWGYGDGRTVCGICVASAINDLPRARTLAASTRKALGSFGLKLNYGEVPLEIGDRTWLTSVRSQRQTLLTLSEATAFTSTMTKTLNGKVVSKSVSMYVLNGMPQDIFKGTMAHELMHAWNHLNCQVRHTPALEEGSANFVETLVLGRLGTSDAKHQIRAIEKSTDPSYGEGYRRVKRLVADLGFEALLETLKTSPDFPPGY